MIDPSRTVALVGRPNVGKSRLFNRLCGKRMSIVHDMPGVTRDLISTEVRDDYVLLDTGGIGMEIEMTSIEPWQTQTPSPNWRGAWEYHRGQVII